MANLTAALETALSNYVARGDAMPALTTPVRVQLLSALGTGGSAGTPIAGAIVDYGASATATQTASNDAILRFEGLANPTTVAGYRLIDSAGTPTVILDNIARTGGNVTVTGGVFEVPAQGLTATSS